MERDFEQLQIKDDLMITLEIDEKPIKNLLKAIQNLDPKDQGKSVFRGFKDAALLVEGKLKENISGRLLNVRSGHLRSSIGSKVETKENGIVATIGSGARQGQRIKYADIQETGGTVRPKIRQWLTIPLDAAKTPAGVTRFSAQDVRDGSTKYKSSFIRNGIIFGVLGRGIVPLFVLKKSVNIPASRYMSITAKETEKEANSEILKGVKKALSEGEGK